MSSLRKNDWVKFSNIVSEHIENYTVPQYGDRGEDLCTHYGAEEHIANIRKYIARFGKNSRQGQQKLDLLKIAHFAQMAYDKCDTDS